MKGGGLKHYKGTRAAISVTNVMAARLDVIQAFDIVFQDEVDIDLEEVSEHEDNMEENSDNSPSEEEDFDEEEQAARQTFMSKNGALCWSSLLQQVAGRMAAENLIRMTPGADCSKTSVVKHNTLSLLTETLNKG